MELLVGRESLKPSLEKKKRENHFLFFSGLHMIQT